MLQQQRYLYNCLNLMRAKCPTHLPDLNLIPWMRNVQHIGQNLSGGTVVQLSTSHYISLRDVFSIILYCTEPQKLSLNFHFRRTTGKVVLRYIRREPYLLQLHAWDYESKWMIRSDLVDSAVWMEFNFLLYFPALQLCHAFKSFIHWFFTFIYPCIVINPYNKTN
jgi:hypothetical protein